VEHLEDAGRFTDVRPNHWVEHVRTPTMSVGTYSIPAGGVDDQSAHTEDEVYVVTAGRASFTAAGRTLDLHAGVTLFVGAGEAHRFHDVTEDLALLSVVAPPYSGD
jgi:mannose-6-phosphate isomerase-like protein (cupin superfamily)